MMNYDRIRPAHGDESFPVDWTEGVSASGGLFRLLVALTHVLEVIFGMWHYEGMS